MIVNNATEKYSGVAMECVVCNMCGVVARTTIRAMRCLCRKAANLAGCMTLLSGMIKAYLGRGQASQNLW